MPTDDRQICPACGRALYRTGAQIRLEPSRHQTPVRVEGVDYESDPIEYTADEPSISAMTTEEYAALLKYRWMESRIPALDALVAFVPDGPELDAVVAETLERTGCDRWYPVDGGHRVLLPHKGDEYDASRFSVAPGAWNHEHCDICSETIQPMTLCHVTEPEQPHIVLCVGCYARHVASRQ